MGSLDRQLFKNEGGYSNKLPEEQKTRLYHLFCKYEVSGHDIKGKRNITVLWLHMKSPVLAKVRKLLKKHYLYVTFCHFPHGTYELSINPYICLLGK